MNERTRLTLKKKSEEINISERLHKVLAASGVASRRSVEDRIARGDVKVNGEVAGVGAQVSPGDRIQIDDRTLVVKHVPGSYGRVLVYNKPDGEVTSRQDPEGRATVFEKLPKIRGARWISIGRLDINTQGLLVFTSNGELAHKLMHPTQGFRREYVCRIHGEPGEEALRQLQAGVELEDGPARFDVIEAMDSAGGSNEWYRVEISEGRNREVRRLWEAVGFTVSRLKRTRFGPFSLPKGLHRGELAELSEEDVQSVCREVGLPPPPPTLHAEDERERKLRRTRKQSELSAPPGAKRLKAERAYLGYLGGHITGEERPVRTERRSPDDRFDPRAGKRRAAGMGMGKAAGRGAAKKGRGRAGAKEPGPRMALPGYEAQPTFIYDPMTGAFGKAPTTSRRAPKSKARSGPDSSASSLYRSEPSYKPPTYSSFVDPETGEIDGNRHIPNDNIGNEAPRPAAAPRPPRGQRHGPRRESQGQPPIAPQAPGPGRGGRGRGGRGGSKPEAAVLAEAPAAAEATAPGAPGKRRRRFRRRRGGSGAAPGPQAGSPPAPPGGED